MWFRRPLIWIYTAYHDDSPRISRSSYFIFIFFGFARNSNMIQYAYTLWSINRDIPCCQFFITFNTISIFVVHPMILPGKGYMPNVGKAQPPQLVRIDEFPVNTLLSCSSTAVPNKYTTINIYIYISHWIHGILTYIFHKRSTEQINHTRILWI